MLIQVNFFFGGGTQAGTPFIMLSIASVLKQGSHFANTINIGFSPGPKKGTEPQHQVTSPTQALLEAERHADSPVGYPSPP